MILSDVQALLIKHEGFRSKPYLCTVGRLTLGFGRNIQDKGISEKEAFYLLNEDIKACHNDLSTYFFPCQFDMFPEPVQNVLISMRFQLGHDGFKGFKKMIFAFKDENYHEATMQMKYSKWYRQTPNRAKELISMIEKVIEDEE